METKSKWIMSQQWGDRKSFPMMLACLTLMRVITSKNFEDTLGIKYGKCLIDMDDKRNYTRLYVKENLWNRFCDQSYKKAKENPEFQKRLIKEFQKKVPKFLGFCKRVSKNNFKERTNKELWQYYQEYIKLYEDIFIWGEPFAFGARFKLSDHLSDYLRKILAEKKQLEKFDEYFSILITPKQKPFLTEEKEESLKIALKISKRTEWKKLFKKDLKIIKKEIVKFPSLNKRIESHTENYQWISYNYGAYLYTKSHFLKNIQNLIIKKEIKLELNKIEERYENILKKQRRIIKKLEINKYHQKLFEALRWNSFIIDYKKKIFTVSHFLINFSLIKEIAQRLKIEQKYIHCLSENETGKVLLESKISPEILKGRFGKSVVLINNGKIKLMIGKEAKDFLKKQKIEEKKLKIRELKGQTANFGKVKGRAKIIPGFKDFKKMKKGNILITHMTTPEFAPIFEKAKAIITDEGGITCHAAIVSRELNIPCIVGTKIATKVLKDEDLMMVDAGRGIVEILKQKN